MQKKTAKAEDLKNVQAAKEAGLEKEAKEAESQCREAQATLNSEQKAAQKDIIAGIDAKLGYLTEFVNNERKGKDKQQSYRPASKGRGC